MEAQLRVTTDQMRLAQKRAEEAQTAPEVDPNVVPAPIQAKLDAAAETEQLLRDELEAARAATQRVEQEREALVQAHEEEMRSQSGQLDQVRVNARLAEEERQRILAEAAAGPSADVIPPDAQAQIAELTQQLARSEAERAMLRAGRPRPCTRRGTGSWRTSSQRSVPSCPGTGSTATAGCAGNPCGCPRGSRGGSRRARGARGTRRGRGGAGARGRAPA